MSIKDYFNTAITNMFRNKKNKFYIIIMVFCSVLALVIIFFMYNFRNLYVDTIQKQISFRTLMVSPNVDTQYFEENKKELGLKWNQYLEESYSKAIEELLNIKYVQEAFRNDYRSFYTDGSSFKNDNLDGTVALLYGSKKQLPKVIKGRTFKENERNVAICPLKFYPSTLESDNLGIPKVNKSYMIDGKTILGRTFTITYDIYGSQLETIDKGSYSFEIVGLYNSEKSMNTYADCYIPVDDIIELTHKQNMNNINVDDYDDESFGYSWTSLNLIVDKTKNVDFVKNEAELLGYWVNVGGEIDTTLVTIINISSVIILVVVLTAVLILTASYIRKKITNESKTIGILRASGYTKDDIKKIYLLETAITNTFSYIIGLIIFLVLFFIFKQTRIYMGLLFLGTRISMNFLIFLCSFVVIVVFSALIVNHSISKKMQSNIVLLIGSEE